MVRLELLGCCVLLADSVPVRGRAARAHRLALLAILAVAGPRPVSRDKLLALLWPERDEDSGRHLLSQTLYLLRQELGGDGVLVAGDALRLNEARVSSDVQAFLAAGDAEDPALAASFYRGPFLDGFHLAGSLEFEEWAEVQRRRLADCYEQNVERLAEAAVLAGDHAAAVEWSRKLALQHPYSTRHALRLARTMAAAGDPVAALRHARSHAALIREELGMEADATLAAFIQSPPVIAPPLSGQPAPASAGAGISARVEELTEREPPGLPGSRAGRRIRAPRLKTSLATSAAVALLVVAAVSAAGRGAGAGRPGPDPTRSVAVLPFTDLGGDVGDDGYFADGVHEDLLVSLSGISSVRVIGRTSVMPYRGAGLRAQRIAAELGVTHIVEGTVRRDGDRVLVTVKLIDASDSRQVWAERYERELSQVFALQAEIAERMAEALHVRLTPGEGRRMAASSNTRLETYDLYLRGREYLERRRAPDLELGIGLLRKAIATDSFFAAAHARLAVAYALKVDVFAGDRAWADSGVATARRAVELDPQLSGAHFALGTAHLVRGEHEAARASFEYAIALDPGGYRPLTNLGALHARRGRYDESLRLHRRAAELNPRAIANALSLASVYGILGFFEEAEPLIRRVRMLQPDLGVGGWHVLLQLALLRAELDSVPALSAALVAAHPDDGTAWAMAGNALLLAGHGESARAYLERANSLAPGASWIAPGEVALGYARIAAGDTTAGLALLRHYIDAALPQAMQPDRPDVWYGLAAAYAVVGERREAVRWFRTFVRHGLGLYRVRLRDPLFDGVRDDPVFQRLLAESNSRLDLMRNRIQRELR
jgi:TolB-like protein/DNA-binding SARP family transcriptional activator